MVTSLKDLAQEMRRELASGPFGYTRRMLSGGLVLFLFRNGAHWRLTLRRLRVYPSENEVAICCRAFAVPAGTEPARREVDAVPAVTAGGRGGNFFVWHCIDLIWSEAEGAPQPVQTEAGSEERLHA